MEASKDDDEDKPQMSSKIAIALLIFITVVCQHLTALILFRELIAVVRLLQLRLNFSLILLTALLRAATLARSLLASFFFQS